jgi:hypothetical protein
MTHQGWTATHSLDSFDCTLANLRELVFGCLEAAEARSVCEIGAEHGLFTSELLAWAKPRAARVSAIDPAPRRRLRELAQDHPELALVIATSERALGAIEPPEAVIVDGDHNYHTVSAELVAIEALGEGRLPLVLCHDVGWPLGRRDSYHAPERIPPAARHPYSEQGFLVPGEPGLAARGLYYERIAAREGGAQNGVLAAVEDFCGEREHLALALCAPFFGLAVLFDRRDRRAAALAAALSPFDRNPLLERIEQKRVFHLVSEFCNLQRVDALLSADYVHRYRLIGRLLPILDSGAFALAERLSALRQRGLPNLSRADLAALVDDLAADDIDLAELRAHPEPAPDHYAVRAVEGPVKAPRAVSPPGPSDLASETS